MQRKQINVKFGVLPFERMLDPDLKPKLMIRKKAFGDTLLCLVDMCICCNFLLQAGKYLIILKITYTMVDTVHT
jgi:hypothetical protein